MERRSKGGLVIQEKVNGTKSQNAFLTKKKGKTGTTNTPQTQKPEGSG